MNEEELIKRRHVVAVARTWLGTPYFHNGSIKGGGTDCGMFVLESFAEAGVFPRFDVGRYTHDWHMHRGEERYLEEVERCMKRVDTTEDPINGRAGFNPPPASLLMFRVGRTFSHGAIVTEWPRVIHASHPEMCVNECSVIGTRMAKCPIRLYDAWGES